MEKRESIINMEKRESIINPEAREERTFAEIGTRSIGKFDEQRNEDRITATGDTIIVCDGVGGAERGGEEADMATKFLKEELTEILKGVSLKEREETLDRAIEATREFLSAQKQAGGLSARSETTLTLVDIYQDKAILRWIGDSPIYFLPKKGEARRLNIAHNLRDIVIDDLFKNEKEKLKARELMDNIKTQNDLKKALKEMPSLGVVLNIKKNIIIQTISEDKAPGKMAVDLKEGDVIIVGSDGLYNLTNEEIKKIVAKSSDMQEAADKLASAASEEGRIAAQAEAEDKNPENIRASFDDTTVGAIKLKPKKERAEKNPQQEDRLTEKKELVGVEDNSLEAKILKINEARLRLDNAMKDLEVLGVIGGKIGTNNLDKINNAAVEEYEAAKQNYKETISETMKWLIKITKDPNADPQSKTEAIKKLKKIKEIFDQELKIKTA